MAYTREIVSLYRQTHRLVVEVAPKRRGGVSVVRGLKGQPGREWARVALFGPDAYDTAPGDVFTSLLVEHVEDESSTLGALASKLADLAPAYGAPGDAVKEAGDDLRYRAESMRRSAAGLLTADLERPFRVVLMGRTMAGKSTLFEFLSMGDGGRVGDGRQRVTREPCLRPSDALGFDIVDTPGVGALDGAEDYKTAFREVPDADLVLWVATDQATQENTGSALQELGLLGKPIVVALNCMADLKEPINFEDFIEDPDALYGGDSLGNLKPIDRFLASVGGQRLQAVQIHAQAALQSAVGDHAAAIADLLRTNSQVDLLIATLRAERDRTEASRRALSTADRVRTNVLDSAQTIARWHADLSRLLVAGRGAHTTFATQARRRIDDATEELNAAVSSIIGGRERWFEEFKIDGDVSVLWEAEARKIESEITEAASGVSDRLFADLQVIAADVADDWASFKAGTFDDLTGFGDVWGNRLLKAGHRLAMAAALGEGGMKLGALVGSFIPGPGTVIGGALGAVLGGLAGFFLNPLNKLIDGLIDTLFRSKAEVHRRRREQVRDQLRPVLQNIRSAVESNIADLTAGWRTHLQGSLSEREAELDQLERATEITAACGRSVRETLAEIDIDTARRLLGLAGRERAAAAVMRATRWQGVGIAIELAEPHFSEAVLFPVDTVEVMTPIPSPATSAAASALQLVLGLTSGDATIASLTPSTLRLSLHDPVPEGVRQTWTDFAYAHTGIKPVIVSGGTE